MSIKPIITIPDPILRVTSKPIERVDDELRGFIKDMFETMYDAPGIGLAAIQVAEPLRLLVMDVTEPTEAPVEGEEGEAVEVEEKPNPIAMINPEIIWSSDLPSTYEEGCLSIPTYYAKVERPAEVKVAYVDEQGNKQELHADGLLATCVQHEIDHLDGKLFIDYLSKLKRDMVIKKFTKLTNQNGPLIG